MKRKEKYKVYYSKFDVDKDTLSFFEKLSNLYKLNVLFEKGLINKVEYEKIKQLIGFVADY